MKPIKIDTKKLKIPFYVRTALDQDHVLKLAELYEAGASLPPIEVTESNEIIDGRHRKEAWELAKPGQPIEGIVIEDKDPVTLLGRALTANEGGSLQPTRADIVHTVRQMLIEKASERRIYELLPYPRAITRKYLDAAKSKIKKGLLQQARQDVLDGLTVKEAATKHGVEIADLKKAISPSLGVNQNMLSNTVKDLRSRFYSLSRANQALVKRLVMSYVDGDVQEKVVNEVLEKIETLVQAQVRHINDWKSRFTSARKGELLNWREVSEVKEGE